MTVACLFWWNLAALKASDTCTVSENGLSPLKAGKKQTSWPLAPITRNVRWLDRLSTGATSVNLFRNTLKVFSQKKVKTETSKMRNTVSSLFKRARPRVKYSRVSLRPIRQQRSRSFGRDSSVQSTRSTSIPFWTSARLQGRLKEGLSLKVTASRAAIGK